MATVLVSTQSNVIRLMRGDNLSVRCTVKSYSTGAVVNITGYTPYLTVKRNPVDDDADAVFQILGTLVSSGTGGVCTFAITEEQTTIQPGTYYYDITIYDASSNVKTVVPTNKFIIDWDVTRKHS
jgi:hypothetical protein